MKCRRPWTALIPFSAFLPPLLGMIVLVGRYGISTQTVEQLQFVSLLHSIFVEHKFAFHLLFWQQPTSDHITLLPILALLVWAPATHWNVTLELVATPILTVLNGWLLLRLVRQLDDTKQDWRLTAQACAAGLLLCASQFWWSWIWSMNALFSFMSTCCLVTLTLLAHPNRGGYRFWLAATVCAVATYSFGNGFTTWLAAMPLLLLDARRARKRHDILLWIVLAAATTGFYALHYRTPGHIPYLNLFTRSGWVFLSHFFSTQWGATLVPDQQWAIHIGRMVLAMGVVLLLDAPRKGQHGRIVFALAGVMVFSMLTSLLIGFSRGMLGIEFALESRYGPTIAIGVLVPVLLLLRRLSALGTVFVLCLLLWNWLSIFPLSHKQVTEAHRVITRGKACIETYRIASDACLGLLYFGDGPYVREKAMQLETLGYLRPFAIPDEIVWREPVHSQFAGTMLTPLRRSGSLIVAGSAKQRVCAADTRILVTTTQDRRLLGTTFAVSEWSNNAGGTGCSEGSWSIELPPTTYDMADGDISAWAYDPAERIATPLRRE